MEGAQYSRVRGRRTCGHSNSSGRQRAETGRVCVCSIGYQEMELRQSCVVLEWR